MIRIFKVRKEGVSDILTYKADHIQIDDLGNLCFYDVNEEQGKSHFPRRLVRVLVKGEYKEVFESKDKSV
jgi:hypothetical protein